MYFRYHKLKKGTGLILHEGINANLSITLTKMYTYYNGICFKISSIENTVKKYPRHNVWGWEYFSFDFNKNIPRKNLPSVDLYFTSENNTYGIVRRFWPDGEPFTLHMNNGQNYFEVGLMQNKYIYSKEKQECRQEPYYHNYGRNIILSANYSGCPKKCLPHSLPKEITRYPILILYTLICWYNNNNEF